MFFFCFYRLLFRPFDPQRADAGPPDFSLHQQRQVPPRRVRRQHRPRPVPAHSHQLFLSAVHPLQILQRKCRMLRPPVYWNWTNARIDTVSPVESRWWSTGGNNWRASLSCTPWPPASSSGSPWSCKKQCTASSTRSFRTTRKSQMRPSPYSRSRLTRQVNSAEQSWKVDHK